MICLYCFHAKTRVVNSRGHKKAPGTWRRHECEHCHGVFSTLEAPVMADSYTITDVASKAPYSRTQLANSLLSAFGHLSGAQRYETVDWLTATIETSLMQTAHDGTLSKHELGTLAHEVLSNYDAVAGVQYAARIGLLSAVNQKRRGRPTLR